MQRMWRLGTRGTAKEAEDAASGDIGSGSIISSALGEIKVTLSGLVRSGDAMFGFSVAHGFPDGRAAEVFEVASRQAIGRYSPNDSLNQVEGTDLRHYLRFFRVDEQVICRALVAGEPVPESELRAELVVRVSGTKSAAASALIIRIGANAHVEDTGDTTKQSELVGGILIRPTGAVSDFAGSGDSGAMVVTKTGRPVGVIVARNEEYVLLAPIAPAFAKHRVSLLNRFEADAWNDTGTRAVSSAAQPRRRSFVFSSEAVSEGNSDKLCDRISDEIVDLIYREARKSGVDPASVRAACETMVTTNRVVLAGEVRVPRSLLLLDADRNVVRNSAGSPLVDPKPIRKAVRKVVRSIGYEHEGFDWRTVKVDVLLHGQSADIAQGVDSYHSHDVGAGDQCIIFGYASSETPAFMPAPLYYANRILELMRDARRKGDVDISKLGPDAKSLLTVRYQDGKPVAVTQVAITTQVVAASLMPGEIRRTVEPFVRLALPPQWITAETQWHINTAGPSIVGGPAHYAGATGRRITVDTYGGAAAHGGGAFSGKDSSKMDRAASYAARYLAKNVVAAGLAERCTIQLAYAIGVSRPLSIYVDLHGTGKVAESRVEDAVAEIADLSPRGIRNALDLDRPIYARTAAYGHFGHPPGRDGSYSWERTNLVSALTRLLA